MGYQELEVFYVIDSAISERLSVCEVSLDRSFYLTYNSRVAESVTNLSDVKVISF